MKTYRSFNNVLAGIWALICAVSGCTKVETENIQEVPLTISASFPALSADLSTRATSPQVNIALNTTAGAYASNVRMYNATSSSTGDITFTPAETGWKILSNTTTTPLTIYGYLADKTPVCYSNSNVAISNGCISNITLKPAYAYVGVRILKDGQTEPAGKYWIVCYRFWSGIASGNDGGWDTSQQIPKLKNYAIQGFTNKVTFYNTDKTTVVGLTADQIASDDNFKRVAPGYLNTSYSDLFKITLPDGGGTLTITSKYSGGKEPEYKAGYCYLFTVNISSAVTVSSCKQQVNIKVTDLDNKPGIFITGNDNTWVPEKVP